MIKGVECLSAKFQPHPLTYACQSELLEDGEIHESSSWLTHTGDRPWRVPQRVIGRLNQRIRIGKILDASDSTVGGGTFWRTGRAPQSLSQAGTLPIGRDRIRPAWLQRKNGPTALDDPVPVRLPAPDNGVEDRVHVSAKTFAVSDRQRVHVAELQIVRYVEY